MRYLVPISTSNWARYIDKINVTDLIYWIVQVLREDLERLAVNTQDTGLMELVKL